MEDGGLSKLDTWCLVNVILRLYKVIANCYDLCHLYVHEKKLLTEKWMENAPGDAIPFQIGQHWDNQIGTMHNQAGWYFIDLPLDMDLQHNCSKVFLLFEGVDSDCEVYLNGRKIGENHTWDKPFVFAVPKTELLWQDDARPNRIVVKAWTPGGLGGVYGLVAAILAE